jgi:phosphoglycerate dehydrogenase-like enzyme
MMCHFFAKNLPRFLAAQAERRWDIFEVEELRGKTLGIIGWVCDTITR